MIYLDNAATTMVSPAVRTAMMPYLSEVYGNPGSLHAAGRNAANAVAEARETVANYMNAESSANIIFTAGGTEANNLALLGAERELWESGQSHIVASATEHSSVIHAIDHYNELGFDVTWVDPDPNGVISLDAIARSLSDDTGMVVVMLANNEIGTINPVMQIGRLCEECGLLFHVDCVQAAGQIPIDVQAMRCTSASISAHKIYGPKGVGALYLKHPETYMPLIYGGSTQEFALRGGTENVPGIIGLARAIQEINDGDVETIANLKAEFYDRLTGELGNAPRYNGVSPYDYGKVLSLTFPGVDAQTLVLMLDAYGVCVSAGSACNSQEIRPSHVLKAIGLSDEDARSTIRVSFSKFNTEDEVLHAAEFLASCVRMQ